MSHWLVKKICLHSHPSQKVASIVTLAFTFVLANGCASIVSKSKWPVTINSTPDGATVTIKNKKGESVHKGVTPMTVTLPSDSGYFSQAKYQFIFEKEGCQPGNLQISSTINPWYFGNIVFGGLIGLCIVDPATGAMWKLEKSQHITLINLKHTDDNEFSSHDQQQRNESIVQQLKDLKDLKEKGILNNEEYEFRRKSLVSQLGEPQGANQDGINKKNIGLVATPSGNLQIIRYNYEDKTQKGVLSVDVSGRGIEAREWVVANIGKICSSKNLTIEAGKEPLTGGKYRIFNESIKDNILTIEFEASY
ncbi:MAG: SHOCT domain-containing protein [Lentisphaeria bacterium]